MYADSASPFRPRNKSRGLVRGTAISSLRAKERRRFGRFLWRSKSRARPQGRSLWIGLGPKRDLLLVSLLLDRGLGHAMMDREEPVGEGKEGEDVVRVACSICLEVVKSGGDRAIAWLQCGHEFHLG